MTTFEIIRNIYGNVKKQRKDKQGKNNGWTNGKSEIKIFRGSR